jgi:hypothetical protein
MTAKFGPQNPPKCLNNALTKPQNALLGPDVAQTYRQHWWSMCLFVLWARLALRVVGEHRPEQLCLLVFLFPDSLVG